MVAITQIVVAGLMTIAVQALPQAARPSTTGTPAPPAAPPAAAAGSALFEALFSAPTAIKRFQKLLTTGEAPALLTGEALRKATVFNFNAAKPAKNATGGDAPGGAALGANIENFPILTGLGISTTLGFLEPCGINTPHIHPRATEFLTLVEGENLKFGYVLENGLVAGANNPEVSGFLNKFEGTVFPQGSIHFQFNDSCKKATFVAALNSEDPGTSQVAQNFFALNKQVLSATLGFPKTIDGKNIEDFRAALPTNLAQDMDVCLARCKST